MATATRHWTENKNKTFSNSTPKKKSRLAGSAPKETVELDQKDTSREKLKQNQNVLLATEGHLVSYRLDPADNTSNCSKLSERCHFGDNLKEVLSR